VKIENEIRSGRYWKPLHDSLNIYFNDIFVKNRNGVLNLTNSIARVHRAIKRIQNSSNTYVNDDDIIAQKKANIKNMREKRSKIKAINTRILKYTMTEPELNMLMLVMNKEIVNELLKGKYYNIPYGIGKFRLREVIMTKGARSINWPKSIENHLRITKKDAPILYHKFHVEKSMTKKEYFRLSKPFVAPTKPNKLWISYNVMQDWVFPSWQPNYAFINSVGNPYRFKFTAYNHLPNDYRVDDYTTAAALEYLNTPEKIFDEIKIGNINKAIYLQMLDNNYKYKIVEI